MDKLLNLLSEFYGENRKFSNDNGLLTMTNGVENLSGAYAQTYIISLQGGFIQRLVEQDKIDLEKLPIRFEQYYQNSEVADYIVEDEKILIMLLSISEQPIDLLCSLIK